MLRHHARSPSLPLSMCVAQESDCEMESEEKESGGLWAKVKEECGEVDLLAALDLGAEVGGPCTIQ